MNEEHTCAYCGAPATHQFKNGKWCCQSSRSACPEIRKQLSQRTTQQHLIQKQVSGSGWLVKGSKTVDDRIETKYPSRGDHVCVYCGGHADYQLKDGRWCCQPKSNSCPVRSKLCANKRNPDGTPVRDYKAVYANLPEETKQRMLAFHSEQAKKKRSQTIRQMYLNGELVGSWTGRKHTEEEISKIRNTVVAYRLANGIWSSPRVSPKGCAYIDQLNESKGWHLQHGLNGGEISCDGYFMDGYDKELNIAFEYDEPYHYTDVETNTLKPKDIERMDHIHKALGCRFFRYNEKTDTLYEVSFS